MHRNPPTPEIWPKMHQLNFLSSAYLQHDVDVPMKVDIGVECGGSIDAACMTEPDKLGNCDPGTHIQLEGIVWNETESK